jgi:putative N6-adenine-specific DNA methylase
LSIDMSGERLDRRGYRLETGRAPLREHLAAALIRIAGWDPREPLVDPMCGAGTLAIEAGLAARRIAPGRARRFAFESWPSTDRQVWQALCRAADEAMLDTPPAPIFASDRNAGQVRVAERNAARAGVRDAIAFARQDLFELAPPAEHGLLIVNPPYGRRVTEVRELDALYQGLARQLATVWRRWRRAVVSAAPALDEHLAALATRSVPFRHGGLQCRLAILDPGA